MPSQLKKMKDLNEETYGFVQFTKVLKGYQPTQVSLIVARQEITKVLMCFSNSTLNTEHYGYVFIIYTATQWTALGNVIQVVHPTIVDAYVGNDQAARYWYEASEAIYVAYKRHSDATVQIILHIFEKTYFLFFRMPINTLLVMHHWNSLLAYLEDAYITNT